MRPWRARQAGRNVFEVRVPLQRRGGWEAWALLTGDIHWDSPVCDRKLLASHLQLAVDRGACWLDCGDFFDAMQGKYDRRASKGGLRPEHASGSYFDALVKTAGDWLAPYAKQLVVLGEGNHEAAVREKWETDLTERLVAVLNASHGAACFGGGFSGWVVFVFQCDEPGAAGRGYRVTLHYDHGYAGGGPVTHDAIQYNRRSVYLDADVIWSGHTHDAWSKDLVRVGLSRGLEVVHRQLWQIKTSTYSQQYGDGSRGWHAQTGKPPKPLGGYWLRFYYCTRDERVKLEPVRAQ